MIRRKDPLTESECALMVSGKLTNDQLCRKFGAGDSTIKRAQYAIRAGDPIVYLFKVTAASRGENSNPRKRYSKKDLPYEGCESPLGLDPVGACDKHLEDLRRVYGERALL